MLSTKKFRTDINGLRAWAVIAVVLYHFGVPGFSGGFVGVDIFFVISGFLMSGIIINGLVNGNFSIWSFYFARAKRIIPALAVLCAALLIIGWIYLPFFDYRALAIHTITALGFFSNIQFWREAGYFDVASHEKLLLHTWSLSVEWQFYLLLPLILMACWKLFKGQRHVKAVLLVCTTASLVLCILVSPRSPSAAFYLFPMRAWEMLAGGLVYATANSFALSERYRKWSELLGFALIIVAITVFDTNDNWPGWRAIIPVAGAVLVLISSRQASFWTGTKIAQWLGNCSYSLYLWHWPFVVALFYLDISHQAVAVVLGIALSIAFGGLSYRFIEYPTRKRLSPLPYWPTLVTMGTISAVVLIPSLYILQAQGIPGRFSKQVQVAARETLDHNSRRNECHSTEGLEFKTCVYGGPHVKVILLGDSHASAVVTSVQASLRTPQDGVQAFSYSSCPTLFGVHNEKIELKCAQFNEWAMKQIVDLPTNIPVIIVNRTSEYVYGGEGSSNAPNNKPTVFFEHPVSKLTPEFLSEFREKLISSTCRIAKQRQVYLVRPIPSMSVNVPKTIARSLVFGHPKVPSIPLDAYYQRNAFVWEAQNAAKAQCGVGILNPIPYLCKNGNCHSELNGRPIYYDDNHLSEFGNRLLIPMFLQATRQLKTSVPRHSWTRSEHAMGPTIQ